MGGGSLLGAKELLKELRSQGIELKVIDGSLRARPSELLTDEARQRIAGCKSEVLALLRGEVSFLEPQTIAHIRRLAPLIGTIVEFDGRKGLLIGVFRDRAIVDTGKVILSLHDHDVRAP